MSEDIENRLRRAMRPVDPPEGFAERVLRALPDKQPRPALTPVAVLRPAPRASAWQRFTAPAALAASLMVAVLFGAHVGIETERQEQRDGLAASRQLMEALRVTSQKLDLAYQAVQTPPETAGSTEENRS
jgi:hypothetical protein